MTHANDRFDPDRTRRFLEASRALTGFDDLAEQLAPQFLAAMDEIYGSDRIQALLEHDPDRGFDELLKEDANAAALRQIVLLWYTGFTFSADGRSALTTTTAEAYFEGLLWRAIRAHPPGLSGGYFGHWRYGPED